MLPLVGISEPFGTALYPLKCCLLRQLCRFWNRAIVVCLFWSYFCFRTLQHQTSQDRLTLLQGKLIESLPSSSSVLTCRHLRWFLFLYEPSPASPSKKNPSISFFFNTVKEPTCCLETISVCTPLEPPKHLRWCSRCMRTFSFEWELNPGNELRSICVVFLR